MRNTTTAPKKEYQGLKIEYPKITLESYKNAWQNVERLGRKLNQLWKTKKSSLEILREERE